MRTILIVDDEKNIRSTVGQTFMLDGFRVLEAEHGLAALAVLDKTGVDLILSDLQMPEMDGLEFLRALRERGDDTPVLFLTAHGTIERAVEAVRYGAFDFIEKPPHADKILLAARNALKQRDLIEENRELRAEGNGSLEMIGSTPVMTEMFEEIRRVAPTKIRVLILGENGTGKELIARALHTQSTRSDQPFVRVNCAAIPKDLFESELFGHEKGAFTGATNRRRGKWVRADKGTLFLDEIGEIPLELQPKMLRTLESGEVEPVGSEQEVQVDVRVIAATNRDLDKEVAEGRFRQDLYYRLQVLTLTAPPLRDRKEDIPALLAHFLVHAAAQNNLEAKTLSPAAMEALRFHDFPGNVRELRNLAERLLILARKNPIEVDELTRCLPSNAASEGELRLKGSLKETLEGIERKLIEDTIERHRGTMAAAARELGLERSHLYKKLRALGIERD